MLMVLNKFKWFGNITTYLKLNREYIQFILYYYITVINISAANIGNY